MRYVMRTRPQYTAGQQRWIGVVFAFFFVLVLLSGRFLLSPQDSESELFVAKDPLDELVEGETFTQRAALLAHRSPRGNRFTDEEYRDWSTLPPCLQLVGGNQTVDEGFAITEVKRSKRKQLNRDISDMEARHALLERTKRGMLKVQFREWIPDDPIHFRLLSPDSAETVFEIHLYDGSQMNAKAKYVRRYWSDEICAWANE